MTALLEHPPAVQTFEFEGQHVPVVSDENGEPWFVATNVASILGYRMASDMTRRLDEDEKGTRSVRTPGGPQMASVISEAGLFAAILGSRVEGAKRFKRWVTHDVLPQIRKTGSYGTPALSGPELMAAALIEAQATLARHEATVRELTPRAEAWDALADTAGDYSMRDAAQILSRDHGIDIGQNRLAKYLREIAWVDSHAIPYQRQIDIGRLRSRARYYTHARTGERVLADPQIRITPKGVEELRRLLTEPPQEAA